MRTTRACSSTARARSPRSAALAAIVFLSNELPMPCQQSVRCNKRGEFRQTSPPQAFRLGCQPTSLVVVESHASVSKLLAQNPVLLAQILDRLQLTLIHRAGQRNQHELDRIKNSRHLIRSLLQRSAAAKRDGHRRRRVRRGYSFWE